MRKTVILLFALIIIGASLASGKPADNGSLHNDLDDYIAQLDAKVGVAVIINRTDTIEVNGHRMFPMLSVYKFPIAVAFGDYLHASHLTLDDTVCLAGAALQPGTYSPMRDKYGTDGSFQLTVGQLLAYALQQSDNNASDILLRIMGGPDTTMQILKQRAVTGINIVSTEAEMHADNSRCYANAATPLAMAALLDNYFNEPVDVYSQEVRHMMETCETGTDRLPKPLSGATVGHKTGTGFILPDGRLMAVNDAGHVSLPDGPNYSIAVFIENSGYNLQQTEAIIARISEIVYRHVKSHCGDGVTK